MNLPPCLSNNGNEFFDRWWLKYCHSNWLVLPEYDQRVVGPSQLIGGRNNGVKWFGTDNETDLPRQVSNNGAGSWAVINLEFIAFTTFSTLLQLAGWILISVGLAGLTGCLKCEN